MLEKTFEVAPVKRGEIDFPHISISGVSEEWQEFWLLRERMEQWESDSEEPKNESKTIPSKVPEFEVGQSNQAKLLLTGHKWDEDSNQLLPGINHYHGFLATVLTAYNHHLPLVLSPDDFWLLIALVVSKFLGDNKEMAEKYRYTFVEHQGQKELVVDGVPFGIAPKSPKANKEGWPQFVEEICRLIQANTKTDISSIMTRPFSTSGPVEKSVMGVTLMESMKNYFSFRCVLGCGIPEITLEGSAEDYQSIIQRTEQLAKLLPDLQGYFGRIKGHLEKILKSVDGDVERDYWRTMVVDVPEGSGGQRRFTGWLADFFNTSGKDWKQMNFEDFSSPAVTNTPFKLEDQLYTMKMYDMELKGGFLGTAMDDKRKGAVRPAIGWMTYYLDEYPL